MKKILFLLFFILYIWMLAFANESDNVTVSGIADENVNWAIMPREPLFKPILADPHWPKLYAAYHYYTSKLVKNGMTETSIGRTVPLLAINTGSSPDIEIGVQANATMSFIEATTALDLISADYMVGVPVTFKWDKFSFLARFYHRSGHLGDDVVIRDKIQGKSVFSLEVLEGVMSFEPLEWLRLYGGGGYLYRPNPPDYGYWTYKLGAETHMKTDSFIFPALVAAVNMDGYEGGKYTPMISVAVGTEVFVSNVYLMLEFYEGYAYQGQYFQKKIRFMGIGFYIF